MERARFEVPRRSKWPVALFLVAVLCGMAVGIWYWRDAGEGSASAPAAGTEMLHTARDDATAPAGEAGAPVPTGADARTGGSDPADAGAAAEGNTTGEASPGGSQARVREAMANLPAPAAEIPLETLLDNADAAFDTGNWRTAIDAYKIAAVRLQAELQNTEDDAARQDLGNQLAVVQERIATAQAQSGDAASDAPSLENRTPHAPPTAGEVREMTIKELGNFPYDDEKGGLPADVEALEGMTIRLVGYMVPTYQTDQIRQFTLVPDVYECCFGQPPGVEHTIDVKLPEGKAVMFSYGEIAVTGTLRVNEEMRDGFVMNVFTIEDVTSVRATGRQ